MNKYHFSIVIGIFFVITLMLMGNMASVEYFSPHNIERIYQKDGYERLTLIHYKDNFGNCWVIIDGANGVDMEPIDCSLIENKINTDEVNGI